MGIVTVKRSGYTTVCLSSIAVSIISLYLETSRLSSTSCLLELSALGSNSRSRRRSRDTRSLTEVSLSSAGLGGSSEQDSVGPLRRSLSELIEGEALSASLQNPSTSGLSELKSTDRHLGDLEQAGII